MISFKEYLKQELNKSTDERVISTVIHRESNEKTVYDIIPTIDPNIWTAREIQNVKYLIYKGKILNISNLKKEIDNIYTEHGYTNYGFSKLSEADLVRYTKVRDNIMDIFLNTESSEINPNEIAKRLYHKELKDFAWRPEEY